MLRLGLVATIALLPATGIAFPVQSALGPGCHEDVTGRAFQNFLVEVPTVGLELPEDRTWQKVARFVLDATHVDWSSLDEEQRFLLASLVIGVRAPDTAGDSVMNLDALRSLHADPDPSGQYMHALRGKADDFAEGDRIAVEGTRSILLDLMETSAYYWSLPPRKQIIKGKFFVDFYDRVEVDVWAPMYYLGLAAHVLQDSFSHMLRSDQDGLRAIVHVTNYIDAISNDLDEARDGMAHSTTPDRCDNPKIKDLIDGATASTIDLFYAARAMYNGTDPDATRLLFEAWLAYKPGCSQDNDYCGNQRWVDVFRESPTSSYLGCSVSGAPGRTSGRPSLFMVLSITLLVSFAAWRASRG
jgi:hypothetical protein